MKMIAAVLAAAATLWASGAFAADSGDRTSMPESCSDRSANCVIQDGPPRRRGGEAATNSTPPTGSTSPDNRGSTGAKGGAKPGDPSGGTSR